MAVSQCQQCAISSNAVVTDSIRPFCSQWTTMPMWASYKPCPAEGPGLMLTIASIFIGLSKVRTSLFSSKHPFLQFLTSNNIKARGRLAINIGSLSEGILKGLVKPLSFKTRNELLKNQRFLKIHVQVKDGLRQGSTYLGKWHRLILYKTICMVEKKKLSLPDVLPA